MILPMQTLRGVAQGIAKEPMIFSRKGAISDSQIQMATVDCSLGDRVYHMNAAALPSSGERVSDLVKRFSPFSFTAEESRVLTRGACYLVPLNESLALAPQFSAVASPKSSIGRTDTFVRILIDRYTQYDRAEQGYHGPLYLEITPLSFNIIIASGLEMTQFRVRDRKELFSDGALAALHSQYGVLHRKDGSVMSLDEVEIFNKGYFFHIDLDRDIVGFEAKANPMACLDLSKENYHEIDDFWTPIGRPRGGDIVLTPGRFYLLTTKERVRIPPTCCAEIVPYDVSTGEYRSHYAGFFDNGFGGEDGTHVVLEVRARDVPQRLYHGQRICRMVFEQTQEVPARLYGEGAGSHYTSGNPSLSKHFKDREDAWLG